MKGSTINPAGFQAPAMLHDERDEALTAYIEGHITPEDDYLHRLWRATNIHTIHGRMASGHLQGELLKMLVMMARPDNILEVGTLLGLQCHLSGTRTEAPLGAESSTRSRSTTRWRTSHGPGSEGSDVASFIDFRIGDANIEAPKLGVMFDMAFLDGDKRTYCSTYDTIFPLMNKGGIILADNTLWDGHVVDHDYDHDSQTAGIRNFNDKVAADTRVENVILPERDGLTIIRIKQ